MAGERRLRILARLTGAGESPIEPSRLCDVCADITDMTGAGIMLMSGDFAHGSLCASNPVSALVEQLQFSLGEGPCVEAYNQDRPVLEPDLDSPVTARWMGFSSPAVEAGVRAIFAFPLSIGAVHLGALDLYRDSPGSLTDEQHADAMVMADVAAHAVLVLQANAAPGELATELEAGADFHYVVHQAAGMVAAQLDISVAQALVRLRAHAFGNGLFLVEVAEAVVGRRLRFDPSNDGGDQAERRIE